MDKLLLTVEEVAESLGICVRQVYALLRGGRLESVKIGTSRRVPRVALEEFVERLRADAA